MSALEVSAFLIVALFVWGRTRLGDARGLLRRLGLLVVTSWVVENTSIRAYGFYSYPPDWHFFLDKVPIAIVLIWPVVIHSAWDLARHLLGPRHRGIVWLGAALVLADASLIEPVSVASGLWHWTEPGLFGVPPIGILGWVFHAGLCMLLLERSERGTTREGWMLATPLGTHALLLASWWGCFRWMNASVSAPSAVGVAWVLSVLVVGRSLQLKARTRVPLGELLLRVPAAAFFFVLLVIYGRSQPLLVGWTCAFVPPYCSLIGRQRGVASAVRS